MDKSKWFDDFFDNIKCPMADKWCAQNQWYGRDGFLTERTLEIHVQLVDVDKVDPKTQKYYDEIDKRIYALYKNRLEKYFSMNN